MAESGLKAFSLHEPLFTTPPLHSYNRVEGGGGEVGHCHTLVRVNAE